MLWSPLMFAVTLGGEAHALILQTGAQSGDEFAQSHTVRKKQSWDLLLIVALLVLVIVTSVNKVNNFPETCSGQDIILI